MRFIFSLLLLFSHFSYSACTVTSGTVDNPNYVMTASQLSVGSNAALPATFLSQNSRAPNASTKSVTCTEATSSSKWIISREYDSGAVLTPSPYTGYVGGPVYQSKIPGVGFYLFGVSMPIGPSGSNINTSLASTACDGKNVCQASASTWYLGVNLVKIGDIPAGTVLNMSDIIPCVVFKLGLSESPSTMATFARACFTGTVAISTYTCTTPTSVTVPMGIYSIGKSFSGINSTTQWIDAGITLTGCSTGYGTASGGMSYDTGINTPATISPNTINVYLTPGSDFIDATNGVFKLSADSTATGVGIQVASDAPGSPVNINFNTIPQMTGTNISGSTVKVPLLARYIQTSSTVTPGTANGILTYTINYN
ncbi:fimbrial protein [Klebsiella aerogenes]|nr:fimbrial protein [Klebsiella aerogenes]